MNASEASTSRHRHSSGEDWKANRLKQVIAKLGGEEHFEEVMQQWNGHKACEGMSERWDRIIYYSNIDMTIK